MAKIIYYLAIVALVVTVGGIGLAFWINFEHGALAILIGWISAFILLALGTAIEEYHK